MGKKYNPKPSPHDHMPRPYEKTPIYQATREVLRETHAMTARMSQGYKYTLGEALRKAAMGAAEAVFLAYEERQDLPAKLRRVVRIRTHAHRLLINLRIADDLQQCSRAVYAEQIDRVMHIIRQSEGWAQHVRQEMQGFGPGQNAATTGSSGVPASRIQTPGTEQPRNR